MPRRIRTCVICSQKYVTVEWRHSECLTCSTTKGAKTIQTFGEIRQDAIEDYDENSDGNQVREIRPELIVVDEKTQPMKEADESNEENCDEDNNDENSEDDEDQEGNSEAGDDFHCTQIIQVNSKPNHPQASSITPSIPPSSPVVLTLMSDRNDKPHTNPQKQQQQQQFTVCFACGADLRKTIKSGWKGRLDHIKRCAKKHGLQARDMVMPPAEDMVEATASSNGRTLAATSTSSSWHTVTSALAPSKQTTLSFSNTSANDSNNNNKTSQSTKNALTALMDGARKAAQQPTLVKKKDAFSKRSKRAQTKTSWGPKHTNRSCPAFKKIPGTDFVVDGFHYATPPLTRNYFLTHFHSDHYGGITRQWETGIIYCSAETAQLVHEQLGVDRSWLHPLPSNSTVTLTTGTGKEVNVTLYSANHCPGAILFHFVVPMGSGSTKSQRSILHVGDFRWHRDSMAPLAVLGIDDLYLDTTYCNPKYVLPTQADAIAAAVSTAAAEAHKYQNTRLLMVFGAYTIGKERIYLSVARHLQKKVYVDNRRYRVMKASLPVDDLAWITTNPDETFLWVVPLGHVNMKQLSIYKTVKVGRKERTFDKIVGFRPTGWSLAKGTIITTASRGPLTVHSVPYSEHSSFPELVDCIACLRPKRIIPTVSVSRSQQQVDLLLSHLEKS